MLRWFPRLQVATACFLCSPPDLNFLDPYFIYMYRHYNHCHRATAHLQLNIYYYNWWITYDVSYSYIGPNVEIWLCFASVLNFTCPAFTPRAKENIPSLCCFTVLKKYTWRHVAHFHEGLLLYVMGPDSKSPISFRHPNSRVRHVVITDSRKRIEGHKHGKRVISKSTVFLFKKERGQ
jgi:hypothetical protein